MSQRELPNAQPAHTFEWKPVDGPSGSLIRAVATVADEDPVDIAPLYEVVDPEPLDALFAPTQRRRGPPSGSVRFEYLGYDVVIKANGRGYIYDRAS